MRLYLGSLEAKVLEVIWSQPSAQRVHDVNSKLEKPMAYTTIMTTLDRLHRKGILNRDKSSRAYLYSQAISRREWAQRNLEKFFVDCVGYPAPMRDAFMSCLIDALSEYDAGLLDVLERKIQERKKGVKPAT